MARKGTVLLIALAALCLLWWLRSGLNEGFQAGLPAPTPIPNIMWTYWNTDKPSHVVQGCIDSWRRYNPEMEVRLVTPSTLKRYIDLDPTQISWNDSPARESDIVRLNLLAKYGGYWCDATNLFTARMPFNRSADTELVGYYIAGRTKNDNFPMIESWFFGTVPQGKFITAWRDTFMSITKYGGVDEFLAAMKEMDVDFQGLDIPQYLAIHIAAQKVLQMDMGSGEIQRTMVLLKAEDGPFKYLSRNNWDSRKAIEDLCNGNNSAPMIKFRGAEREILEKDAALANCVLRHSG